MRMKIVIGYDGSKHADAALDDLRLAGLPRDAEALIVSVAEGAMPLMSVSGIAENGLDPERIASAVTYASNAIAKAKEFARLGGERIKSSFLEWEVNAERPCEPTTIKSDPQFVARSIKASAGSPTRYSDAL